MSLMTNPEEEKGTCCSMDGRHESLNNAKFLVDNLQSMNLY